MFVLQKNFYDIMDHVFFLLGQTAPNDVEVAAAVDALPADCCVDAPDVDNRTLLFLASCRAPGYALPLTLRALKRRNASPASAYLLSSSAQLRELLTLFPNIEANKTDGRGKTMLHYLAMVATDDCADGVKMIELFLEHGARRDVLDAQGNTPLDVAQSYERLEADKPNDNVRAMLQVE